MAWKNKIDTFLVKARLLNETLGKDSEFDDLNLQSIDLIESAKDLCIELHGIDWKSKEDKEKEILECMIYRWSIDALDVSILLRDAFLKTSKDFILKLCKGGDEKSKILFNTEVQEICKKAINQNIQLINEIQDLKSGINPIWFHQLSPTQAIANQQEVLIDQLRQIYKSNNNLSSIIPSINKYREYLITYGNSRLLRLRSLIENMDEVSEILGSLSNDSTKEDISSASKSLQSKSESIENEKIVTEAFEQFKSGSGTLKIPIHADGGEMVFKELSIDKKVESWTENQLFPKFYDADLDIKSLYDSSLITLFNTRNKLESLVLNAQGDFKIDQVQLTSNLNKLLTNIKEYSSNLDEEVNMVNRMVGEQLQASKIYDLKNTFLPELNFTNIKKIANQQKWYKPSFWSSWKNEITKTISKQKIPFIKGIQQDPYSFVEERIIEAHNLDANSLFLKKGYLGRSFYVERKEKQNSILKAIKRWKRGYQGSVLITGRRGSGKSSLIDFIPQLIDDLPVVKLNVQSVISLNGRKHQLSHDLCDAINFLSAQSILKPAIICIDDLETWQTEEISMFDTIKDLTDGISKYGKRLFFIIGTNQFMHMHINRMFDFNSRFSEIISMNDMASQSIVDALVVRHNASLKNIDIDENVSLGKRASRISTKSRNNVGASMLAWERYLEKGVKIEFPPLSFNKLVTKHHLLLKVILTNGNLKESSFRKTLTNADNNFFSEEVRKLIGYKILERTFDGYLRVNPFIIDDVEYVLLKEMN